MSEKNGTAPDGATSGGAPAGGAVPRAPRCACLVGPYLSGKTALLEALLHAAGAIDRKGTATQGNTVGDSGAEARSRQMTTDTNIASARFMGDDWYLLDAPGSIELQAEAMNALMVADIAVVVCEPSAEKVASVAPLLKRLDDMGIPHIIFINKVDQIAGSDIRIRDVLAALQAVSARPLVLRQIPLREDSGRIEGYVDLVSERAYRYRTNAPSDLIEVPESVREREQSARQELLETLADFDDTLLEQLLEDTVPETSEIYSQLVRDLHQDLVVPVLLGSAERDHGVHRLWKALRHDGPDIERLLDRLEAPAEPPQLQVFKVQHLPQSGRSAYVRVLSGQVRDGGQAGGHRIGGLHAVRGGDLSKLNEVGVGSVVALSRTEGLQIGLMASASSLEPAPFWPERQEPVYALAVAATSRQDDVKLSGALQKLAEEDSGLTVDTNHETGEILVRGQGDIHLGIVIDRLRNRFNLAVETSTPTVPYKETITRAVKQHTRFKRQTGGHGQFADIHVEIEPQSRGTGFSFQEKIFGGAVPRTFIPAVESGVKEALQRGPLGFPVIDLCVTLTDGQHHPVDSSEMAFKTAGRIAMVEGLPKAGPIALEPIMMVTLSVPSEHTARMQRLVSSRRGQMMGFDARSGWRGWDDVTALIPQAEMQTLIMDLRSATQGLGSYTQRFSHLAEVGGREADRIVGTKGGEAVT